MDDASQLGVSYLRVFGMSLSLASEQLSETLEPVGRRIAPVFEQLQRFAESMSPFLGNFVRWNRLVDAVNESGWLPYRTVAPSEIEALMHDTDKLDDFLSDFHRNNWPEIRADIESRIGQYNLDAEARHTMNEALSAHENRLYRCVCRVLFPEIERILAVRGVTTKRLEDLTEGRSLGELTSQSPFGYILFGKLFLEAFSSKKKREELQQDPMPNRHAAEHGFVQYSSHKHSMNMLVLTDYLFGLLLPEKGHRAAEVENATASPALAK